MKHREKLTIGILAHVDAGKTTLAEAILYLTGSIRKLGRVDHGNAFLDTYSLEKARGITISVSYTHLDVYKRQLFLQRLDGFAQSGLRNLKFRGGLCQAAAPAGGDKIAKLRKTHKSPPLRSLYHVSDMVPLRFGWPLRFASGRYHVHFVHIIPSFLFFFHLYPVFLVSFLLVICK